MEEFNSIWHSIAGDNGYPASYVSEETQLAIPQNQSGMLSLNANWSGPSRMIAMKMINFMSGFASDSFFHLIIDIDCVSVESKTKIFGTKGHGYFESVWMENGKPAKYYRTSEELTPFLGYIENTLAVK